jgi:hypothetical protein
MKHATENKIAENATLMRMAQSRTALLAANSMPPPVMVASHRSRLPAPSILAPLADAPRVTLLLALCVGAIVLGPRRTLGIAGRSGIASWVGSNVRKAVLGAI